MHFKIHPAIGVARLGDSTTTFYIAPETVGTLPIDCDINGLPVTDAHGVEQVVTKFKDADGRVRRQAARFRVYVYATNDATNDADAADGGRELRVGDTIDVVAAGTGTRISGTVLDIEWTVYLANKKACWYQFKQLEGEHGYAESHPLRNAAIVDPAARARLIIDPGPMTVQATGGPHARAELSPGANPDYMQTFPPPLQPRSIDTLGQLIATEAGGACRLLVLGGHGNSGSMQTGFGNPAITAYANNDGWFDDTSDGPVLARIKYQPVTQDDRPMPPDSAPMYANVDTGAWVIVGYPRYAPQVTDMVTMDDVMYDVGVRHFGYAPAIFGVPPFDGTTPWTAQQAEWNAGYSPDFDGEIWPILVRPSNYSFVMDADPTTGGDPHDTSPGGGGNFDTTLLSTPPHDGESDQDRSARSEARMFLWNVLRRAGQENVASTNLSQAGMTSLLWLMPLLCGDNPISNTSPSKFLRLTDTQLFLLGQWAQGKFHNAVAPAAPSVAPAAAPSGAELDRGVLSNALGGAFCPGAEASWIIRNPAIYSDAYRVRLHPRFALNPMLTGASDALAGAAHGPLANTLQPLSTTEGDGGIGGGAEPGDLTKYGPLPWQADFNECTSQTIDITYEGWNQLYLSSTNDPATAMTKDTFWWPAHRPIVVGGANWSQGIPDGTAGDLTMVTAWNGLGFVLITGDGAAQQATLVERNVG